MAVSYIAVSLSVSFSPNSVSSPRSKAAAPLRTASMPFVSEKSMIVAAMRAPVSEQPAVPS